MPVVVHVRHARNPIRVVLRDAGFGVVIRALAIVDVEMGGATSGALRIRVALF